MSKFASLLSFFAALFLLSGCTNTATYFDKDGKVTRIEKNSDFSRAMDGTNQKSQIILMSGNYLKFEISASAGENCTPGMNIKYLSGKSAVINAKDKASFTGTSDVVEKFFSEQLTVSKDGVNISSPAGKAAASGK